MYDYTVYKNTKGQIFTDSIVTRSAYFVADSNVPGDYSVGTRFYRHSSSLGTPLLYCTTPATTPASSSDNGTYSVNLYSGTTKSLVNSLNVTPSETTVSNDMTVVNDVYIGTEKEWKLHVDTLRRALVFQRKSEGSGIYVTQFEIQQENL